MSEWPRLTWTKHETGFRSYPMGSLHLDRYAEILFLGNMSLGAEIGVPRWRWSIKWPGWFFADAPANDKQHAADMATEAWWRAVVTEPPRDVDGEIDMIIARIMVRPPPNSLMTESATYLRQMQRSLTHLYSQELKEDRLPRQVQQMMVNLSAELYARRLAGKAEDGEPSNWSAT